MSSKANLIAYGTIATPIGPLLLAASNEGLIRVAFEAEGHRQVLERLSSDPHAELREDLKLLEPFRQQFDAYFAGERATLDVPIDLRDSAGYRRTVLEFLPSIDPGKTATYAEVAVATGKPRAARAVGTACATNPLPLVIPCHRVVRSDGVIGQFLGGTAVKRQLLDLEAAWNLN